MSAHRRGQCLAVEEQDEFKLRECRNEQGCAQTQTNSLACPAVELSWTSTEGLGWEIELPSRPLPASSSTSSTSPEASPQCEIFLYPRPTSLQVTSLAPCAVARHATPGLALALALCHRSCHNAQLPTVNKNTTTPLFENGSGQFEKPEAPQLLFIFSCP